MEYTGGTELRAHTAPECTASASATPNDTGRADTAVTSDNAPGSSVRVVWSNADTNAVWWLTATHLPAVTGVNPDRAGNVEYTVNDGVQRTAGRCGLAVTQTVRYAKYGT